MKCSSCGESRPVTINASDSVGDLVLCARCWLRRAKEDAEWLADWNKHEQAYRAKQAAGTQHRRSA